MIIKNLTTKRLISQDAKLVESFLDRLLGLLKKSNPKTLIFKTRFGIHTFFLKEPIDVIVLDKNLKVVKLKQNLKPNQLFFWNPKYYWVIELPNKKIKSKIEIGDKLNFM